MPIWQGDQVPCLEGESWRKCHYFGEWTWTDIWGPTRTPTYGGNEYFAVFIDDRAGELTSRELEQFLAGESVKQIMCVHETHQQIQIPEQSMRVILERVRALMHQTGLSKGLWAECARRVFWTRNRTGTRALDGK